MLLAVLVQTDPETIKVDGPSLRAGKVTEIGSGPFCETMICVAMDAFSSFSKRSESSHSTPVIPPESHLHHFARSLQCLVNFRGVKSDDHCLTDEDDRGSHVPQLLEIIQRGGLLNDVLFLKLNALLRKILFRSVAEQSTLLGVHNHGFHHFSSLPQELVKGGFGAAGSTHHRTSRVSWLRRTFGRPQCARWIDRNVVPYHTGTVVFTH
jgi:hypothetical protein